MRKGSPEYKEARKRARHETFISRSIYPKLAEAQRTQQEYGKGRRRAESVNRAYADYNEAFDAGVARRMGEDKPKGQARKGRKTAHVPAGHANGGQFTGESNPPSGPVKAKRQRKAKDTRPKAPAGYSIYHQLEDARAVEDFAEVKRLQGIIKRRKNVSNDKPAPPARKRKPASSEAREVANLKRRASRRNMNPADELAILEGMEAKKTPKPRKRKASASGPPGAEGRQTIYGLGYDQGGGMTREEALALQRGSKPRARKRKASAPRAETTFRQMTPSEKIADAHARYNQEIAHYGAGLPADAEKRLRALRDKRIREAKKRQGAGSAPTRMNRVADSYPKTGKRTRRTKAQAAVVYMDARGGHLAYRRRHPR